LDDDPTFAHIFQMGGSTINQNLMLRKPHPIEPTMPGFFSSRGGLPTSTLAKSCFAYDS
jgi:hypothetical protein